MEKRNNTRRPCNVFGQLTIKWFIENKMIVNADKFQVLLIDKRKQDHMNEVVQIEQQNTKAVPSVELLGIEIGDKL